MLNRQRREAPLLRDAAAQGARVTRRRFGVDAAICTGDHACMRLSGCPSLTVRTLPDPLRDDPVAHIDPTCVGCGNCGEVADAAVLCPSFYEARTVQNPTAWDRFWHRLHARLTGWAQASRESRRLRFDPGA